MQRPRSPSTRNVRQRTLNRYLVTPLNRNIGSAAYLVADPGEIWQQVLFTLAQYNPLQNDLEIHPYPVLLFWKYYLEAGGPQIDLDADTLAYVRDLDLFIQNYGPELYPLEMELIEDRLRGISRSDLRGQITQIKNNFPGGSSRYYNDYEYFSEYALSRMQDVIRTHPGPILRIPAEIAKLMVDNLRILYDPYDSLLKIQVIELGDESQEIPGYVFGRSL